MLTAILRAKRVYLHGLEAVCVPGPSTRDGKQASLSRPTPTWPSALQPHAQIDPSSASAALQSYLIIMPLCLPL